MRLSKVQTEAGASSKDLQVVRTEIAVQYSMTPELMPLTLQKIGTRGVVERTLIARHYGICKAITALYTAEQLITRRMRLRPKSRADQQFLERNIDGKGFSRIVNNSQ